MIAKPVSKGLGIANAEAATHAPYEYLRIDIPLTLPIEQDYCRIN